MACDTQYEEKTPQELLTPRKYSQTSMMISPLSLFVRRTEDKIVSLDKAETSKRARNGQHITINNPHYDRERTIQVIQMFIDTGKVKYILFDDQQVVDHFKNLKQPNGNPVVQNPGVNHDEHFTYILTRHSLVSLLIKFHHQNSPLHLRCLNHPPIQLCRNRCGKGIELL